MESQSKMTRLMSNQKVRLFELLEENYHILSGKPNRSNGEKTAVWEEIKEILNDMGPPKTTDKWRRVWTDIRKTLRKKVSLRQTYETNGARIPDEYIFSESDLWVIRICGMDAIEKPSKIVKAEVVDIDYLYPGAPSPRLSEEKPTRSSQRVSNRKSPRRKLKDEEFIDDEDALIDDSCSLLCPLIFSDDKATQCSETPSNSSPMKKKSRLNSTNLFVEKDPVHVAPAADNKEQLKQMIYLQRKQLAVTRQIHERQKCHNADQRQFNARVTNLLEGILQQLKTNQVTK